MIKYPVCYVLQHKKYGTYPQNARLGACFTEHVLQEYDKSEEWGSCFYTKKIEVAKMWSTLSKIKAHLTKDTARFFNIIGSDKTIVGAETLFP